MVGSMGVHTGVSETQQGEEVSLWRADQSPNRWMEVSSWKRGLVWGVRAWEGWGGNLCRGAAGDGEWEAPSKESRHSVREGDNGNGRLVTVLVIYFCVTIYPKLSGLEQQTFIFYFYLKIFLFSSWLHAACGNLSSLTRVQTRAPCSGSTGP